MKTIIFLVTGSTFLLDYLELEEIRKSVSLRIVFVIKESLISTLPHNISNCIDQLYPVKTKNEEFYLSPLNYETTKAAIHSECKQSDDVLLLTFNEANILLMAKLRDEFDLPGDRYSILAKFVDKVKMKEKLLQENIRVPKFTKLSQKILQQTSQQQFSLLEKEIGLPFILKPTSLGGGFGVEKISSLAEYTNCISLAEKDADYEVEEYIEGQLFHCDLIIDKQKLIWAACSEYNAPLLAISDSKCVGSIPRPLELKLSKQLIDFSVKTVLALGQTSGISHVELFYTNSGEIVFLETAARPGGTFIIPMYKKTYGTSILACYLRSLLSIKEQETGPANEFAAWLAMPRQTGIITTFNQLHPESDHETRWFVEKGHYYEASKNMLDSAGLIFLWNSDYEKLQQDFFSLTEFVPYNVESKG